MKWRFDGYNWLVRLEKGEPLVKSLKTLIKQEDIPSAWLNGLGAAQSVELGFYDLAAKTYNWHKIDKLAEITSLQGNIAWQNDEPKLHIHATLSDEKLQAYGGHVRELIVGGTCEILVHRWYEAKLTRSLDDEVGLELLDL